ncbi:L,D-transpeptidase [Paenibacillus sambharensis]|uniref:L,D-transpeptidase n=1 Tax=Paenibacillus sambharensis TaxID=1803190 RepID=A0A2W1LW11_9BACL|nr:L,D-transpeptidase [Paenibacillus sambharensis]PZD95971.1 L,D-transpeptidase [Paenibacillus sambharensis]
MGEREETIYLKYYVKQHPDNKMAWYLLGKEYTMQGKEAKANYCYLQSGAVYEAFERKKHPLLAETPQEAIATYNRQRRKRRYLSRAVLLSIVLLAGSVFAPGMPWKLERGLPAADQSAVQPVPAAGEGQVLKRTAVVFAAEATAEAAGEAAEELLYGKEKPSYGLSVHQEKQGEWTLWTGATDILMSVTSSLDGSRSDIRWHNQEVCRCDAEAAADAPGLIEEWKADRERQWVLASAIKHYQQREGVWPETLDELVRPYPENALSGDTARLAEMFPLVKEQLKSSRAEDKQGAGGSSPPVEEAGKETGQGPINGGIDDKLPDEPLDIVIDRANHRLALMSGQTIVRSYAVGLGGDKTPEGTFQISEKVRNPNGRDNGEFGSRGMTLSDTLYAIHGTDEPDSIEKDESLGCVRMLREDLEELYDMVTLGTKVTITSGVLPDHKSQPADRFKLEPKADETNPSKVYRWL